MGLGESEWEGEGDLERVVEGLGLLQEVQARAATINFKLSTY